MQARDVTALIMRLIQRRVCRAQIARGVPFIKLKTVLPNGANGVVCM